MKSPVSEQHATEAEAVAALRGVLVDGALLTQKDLAAAWTEWTGLPDKFFRRHLDLLPFECRDIWESLPKDQAALSKLCGDKSGNVKLSRLKPYTICFSVLGSVIYSGEGEDDVRGQILNDDWREQLDIAHLDKLESITIEDGRPPERNKPKRRRRKPLSDLDELEQKDFMVYFRVHGVFVLRSQSKAKARQQFCAEWDYCLANFEHLEGLEVLKIEIIQDTEESFGKLEPSSLPEGTMGDDLEIVTPTSQRSMVCPKCGRQVESLQCGHCGSRLPTWQSDLYAAAIKQLAKMGGNRPDAANKEGASDEVVVPEGNTTKETEADMEEPTEGVTRGVKTAKSHEATPVGRKAKARTSPVAAAVSVVRSFQTLDEALDDPVNLDDDTWQAIADQFDLITTLEMKVREKLNLVLIE